LHKVFFFIVPHTHTSYDAMVVLFSFSHTHTSDTMRDDVPSHETVCLILDALDASLCTHRVYGAMYSHLWVSHFQGRAHKHTNTHTHTHTHTHTFPPAPSLPSPPLQAQGREGGARQLRIQAPIPSRIRIWRESARVPRGRAEGGGARRANGRAAGPRR
jgi:hypothetical protein